jgi:hypothetical protein
VRTQPFQQNSREAALSRGSNTGRSKLLQNLWIARMDDVGQMPMRISVFDLAVIGTLMLVNIVATTYGIVSIDIARDLFVARQIVDGAAFPLAGPPINGSSVLGPIWFYSLALTLWVAPSLTATYAIVAFAASLKFLFAYWLGRIVGSREFGLLLALASGMVGVSSFAFMGIGHPSFVEVCSWAMATVAAISVRQRPTRSLSVAVGFCAALMLHAHPTTVLLAVPIGLYWFKEIARQHGVGTSALHALYAIVGSALLFLPLLIRLGAADFTQITGIRASSGGSWSFSELLTVLGSMLWTRPLAFFHTFLPIKLSLSSIAVWIHAALLLAAAIGLVISLSQQKTRTLSAGAIVVLLAVVSGVLLLREITPFYMLYCAAPIIAILLARGWSVWAANSRRVVALLWVGVLLANSLLVGGMIRSSQKGFVSEFWFSTGDMRIAPQPRSPHSWASVRTRDALAKWICTQDRVTSIHGELAKWLDVSIAIELWVACPESYKGVVSIGGIDAASVPIVGLPNGVWKQIGIRPDYIVGGYGLSRLEQVITPAMALEPANGKLYPPRLVEMQASALTPTWTRRWTGSGSSLVLVSPLIASLAESTSAVHFNGVAATMIAKLNDLQVYACLSCGAGHGVWDVSVQRSAQSTTSVTTIQYRGQGQ